MSATVKSISFIQSLTILDISLHAGIRIPGELRLSSAKIDSPQLRAIVVSEITAGDGGPGCVRRILTSHRYGPVRVFGSQMIQIVNGGGTLE
jgi:hypothetical protein